MDDVMVGRPVEVPVNGNGKMPFSWRRVTICAMAWGAVIVMVLTMGPDFDPEETILISNTLVIAAGISGYTVNLLGKK